MPPSPFDTWVPRANLDARQFLRATLICDSGAVESGCGVLLVEQHIQLALTIADRGYVLSHGELVLHDKAEALRGNRDLLMASYFGERATASLDSSANQPPQADPA